MEATIAQVVGEMVEGLCSVAFAIVIVWAMVEVCVLIDRLTRR